MAQNTAIHKMDTFNQDDTEDVSLSIEINDLLQVRMIDEPNTPTYRSRVEDIVERKLLLAWPTNNGVRLIVHRDQNLDFYFVHNGVPHQFFGMVDELHSDSIPKITIIPSSTVRKIQRRQNVRIKCLIPIEIVGSVQENPADGTHSSIYIKTTTCDLSAGGLAFRHLKQMPEGTLLEIKLSLPDNAPVIKIPCRTVFSDNGQETHLMYRTGIQFLALSETDRARIVRYVYKTQLKGLR